MMMTYDYNICNLQIQINTPRELWVEESSRIFAAPPREPDVRIALQCAPELPMSPGERCSAHREKPVWRSGSRIYRGDHDLFREKMHFLTKYDLACPNDLTCLVREEDWRWATRTKYLWPGVMLNYVLLHNRGVVFHASYIACGEEGILFVAPSGTGKSTQAELWRRYRGARVVNGDKAGVTLSGAPAVHGLPFSGSSGICENLSLPLKAVVALSQAKENTVRRLGPSAAVAALCPNLFVDQAIAEEWSLALNLLLDLIVQVPVYALACTPDERAVEALERAMKENMP